MILQRIELSTKRCYQSTHLIWEICKGKCKAAMNQYSNIVKRFTDSSVKLNSCKKKSSFFPFKMLRGQLSRISKFSKTFVSHTFQYGKQRYISSTMSLLGSSEHSISRYPIVEEEDISNLPEDIQQRLMEVKEKGGFLPNVFKVLAYRPDEFRAFFNYYDVLMEKKGTLTKAEKEMIVVATSAVNSCNYCLTAHGALLRIYAKNPILGEQVAFDYHVADITDRQKAMLDFGVEIAEGQPISDEQIDNMKSAGFTSDEIWDIGAIAGFFALSNRMAHLTRMRPNDEFYVLGRLPKEKK